MPTARVSLGLHPVPQKEALSPTFRRPPIDGSLTIPEIYDWHYENSPDHPLFVYADDSGRSTTITWKDVVRATHKLGRAIRRITAGDDSDEAADSPQSVFAIVANNGV